MSAKGIIEGLAQATHHAENCPKRDGSYTCECGVVVHAPAVSALATGLQKAADALMAAAVNHDCPRAREAAQEADRLLDRLGFPHSDPSEGS